MNKNMEYNDCLWTIENTRNIVLKWDQTTFKTTTSIRWRGILFHIRINAHQTENGSTASMTYLYNNKLYDCKLTKWKWAGGSNGIYPPAITTSSHSLKIRGGLNFLSIKEEPIQPNNKTNQFEEFPFEIIKTPDYIIFDIPIKIEKKPEEIKVEKNQVVLYEFKNSNESINSYAYFDKEDLVIDYGILGGDYEDEYFITIKEKHLIYLFDAFLIESKNKAELLIGIMNAFKGKRCFNRVKEYLELKKIPFENSVRHD